MNEGVKKSLNLMKEFYEEIEKSNESPATASVWKNLRETLRPIPNIFIFQTILKQMDLQLQLHCCSCDAQ